MDIGSDQEHFAAETIARAGCGEVAGGCRVTEVIRHSVKSSFCAALGCAAIVGCGGPDETTQIRDLVNGYVADFASHNGPKACSRLTVQAQRRIQARAGILRGRDCGATLTTVSNLPTGEAARQIAKFHAGKIVIDGSDAGVIIEPAAPTAKPTKVVKVNGKWLIDGSIGVSG